MIDLLRFSSVSIVFVIWPNLRFDQSVLLQHLVILVLFQEIKQVFYLQVNKRFLQVWTVLVQNSLAQNVLLTCLRLLANIFNLLEPIFVYGNLLDCSFERFLQNLFLFFGQLHVMASFVFRQNMVERQNLLQLVLLQLADLLRDLADNNRIVKTAEFRFDDGAKQIIDDVA